MLDQHWLGEEKGQGLSEYALLIFLVAITVVFILLTFGLVVVATYQRIIDSILEL
ncbi:MAG: Flp family type IVb pilin [Chloroflexi bacterium]|nr:Flp family type IVb pilin [Chloroflexota bacterium]